MKLKVSTSWNVRNVFQRVFFSFFERRNFPPDVGVMSRSGSIPKEISQKSTLDYKEVFYELVNQNEIRINMTPIKEDPNT